MVSFSCEACGDVVTKKKLDAHKGYCHGASFTCLDCMTHFQGTAYRDHTSCISEAQKYEGKHYKDKPKRKSVFITAPGDELPLQPYVEEVPDEANDGTVVVVETIPAAPDPPLSGHAQSKPNVNVFDFLVDEDPNASKVSLGGSHEQMSMVADAPPIFKSVSPSSDDESRLVAYETNGFTYGADPIHSQSYDTFRTPASKPVRRSRRMDALSTEKKRKRYVEELDLSRARTSSELDEEMLDADGNGLPVLHSGLTGGLHRMLGPPELPPSPDENAPVDSPLSPAKRKRQVASSTTGTVTSGRDGLTVDKRGRRRHASGQVLKVRKVRRSSDESRPRKHHRSQRERSAQSNSPPAKQKAIEYHPEGSPAVGLDNQMVVYKSRAELFLSFVSKGPESSSGYSINKALKRYHRERGQSGAGRDAKAEEEKELWKNLRLKRNERGEVVLFMGPG